MPCRLRSTQLCPNDLAVAGVMLRQSAGSTIMQQQYTCHSFLAGLALGILLAC